MDDETEPVPVSDEAPIDFSFEVIDTDDVKLPGDEYVPKKPRWWEKRPPKNTAKTASTGRRPKRPMTAPKGGLRKPLEELYTAVGMMIMPFDPSCAKVIIEAAPRCAETLADLANSNEVVRRILISLVTTSNVGAVIVAHGPIVMAIAMHHVPVLKNKQEKMFADIVEQFAREQTPETD